MAQWATQRLLSLQITLCLFLIFVQGNKEADEAYKNGRNLVLEYFLPVKAPVSMDVQLRREKRDMEGSGEDDSIFSEVNEKGFDDIDNSTQNAFAKSLLQERPENFMNSLSNTEGSGEIDDVNENESLQIPFLKEEKDSSAGPVISEAEGWITTESLKTPSSTISENGSEVIIEVTSTAMVFDKYENFDVIKADETTTAAPDLIPTVILGTTATTDSYKNITKAHTETFKEGVTTEHFASNQEEHMTPAPQENITLKDSITVLETEAASESFIEPTTMVPNVIIKGNILNNDKSSEPKITPSFVTEETKDFTTLPPVQVTTVPTVVLQKNTVEDIANTVINDNNTPTTKEITTKAPIVSSFSKFLTSNVILSTTEFSKFNPTTLEPVIEEIFKETKIHKKLEAMPGNILQKENLSLAADPLLIMNTRLIDSEESVHLSSSEPKRLGAYIIIGLILLSFSSLVGYITFKRRMNRKRQKFESNQESNDTEKALLSLSDYKDSSELEENHLKNNEITPIVVKSNSQINKFEKNTNFSSPKNLNTTANEKNIEKDNVLKSTAENLTQVIIEGSPKEMEEDKNVPGMEKLIVKTRIDQDSIPKKPIIINRSSTGYMPISQDNI